LLEVKRFAALVNRLKFRRVSAVWEATTGEEGATQVLTSTGHFAYERTSAQWAEQSAVGGHGGIGLLLTRQSDDNLTSEVFHIIVACDCNHEQGKLGFCAGLAYELIALSPFEPFMGAVVQLDDAAEPSRQVIAEHEIKVFPGDTVKCTTPGFLIQCVNRL